MFFVWGGDENCVSNWICGEKVYEMWMGISSSEDSGGDSMKINRTFSIDLWIVKELRDKRNQSQFVCDALKSKLDGDHDKTLNDAGARSLMIYLKAHEDCDPFIKRVLEQSLARTTTNKHAVTNEESLPSKRS